MIGVRILLVALLLASANAFAQQPQQVAMQLPQTRGATAGTAIQGEFALPVRTIKELRQRALFATTVPQRFDFSCGSAALATLLTFHYNFPVTEDTVFRAMYEIGDQERIKREGFSLLDMKRVLAANGYDADGFEASLDDIIEAKVPAIALINENGYNHFVVLKGAVERHVLLGDPAFGTRIITRKEFERMWQAGIFFVVRSHQDKALFNLPAHWKVRPLSPLAMGIDRNLVGNVIFNRPGPDNF